MFWEIVCWYAGIGVLVSCIGIVLRARLWGTTWRQQLAEGWLLWILVIAAWPIGLDLALMHNKPGE